MAPVPLLRLPSCVQAPALPVSAITPAPREFPCAATGLGFQKIDAGFYLETSCEACGLSALLSTIDTLILCVFWDRAHSFLP
jgi:hypothetical protein